MNILYNQLLKAGLPVQSGIYQDADGSIHCHAELTAEQQAQFDAIVAQWQIDYPKAQALTEYAAMIDSWLDSVVAERGYKSAERCVGYLSSTVPAWRAEAQAVSAWRDSVWVTSHEIMTEVEQGIIPPPSQAELIAMLPVLQWPANA